MEGTPIALVKVINSTMLNGVSHYGKQNIKASKEHTINGCGYIINVQWLPEGKTKILEERIVLKLTRGCTSNEYCDAVLKE